MDTLDNIIARNEGFRGNRIDEEKAETLHSLKLMCVRFCHIAPLCRVVGGLVSSDSRHGVVSLIIPMPVMIANPAALALLTDCMAKADTVCVANADEGARLVISFCVEDVWLE